MSALVGVLTSIQNDIKIGTLLELEKAQQPLSYVMMQLQQLEQDITSFTEALIAVLKEDNLEYLECHLSHLCKTRLDQGVRLSDIMSAFDLYEKALKDVLSAFLRNDITKLNRYRRELDALLDKARVYVSECFFQLYEDTVFRQFEQLRIINEISAHLTSTLKLDDVLNYIVINALRLFAAECGSITLIHDNGVLSTQISHGWNNQESPHVIAHHVQSKSGLIVINEQDEISYSLKEVFEQEHLSTIAAIKLSLPKRDLGLLVIGLRSSRKFTQTDECLLLTFANHATIAINNAQLYKETDQQLQDRIKEASILLEHNRAILHSMREGVLAIDVNGYVTLVNNEALRLLGCSPDLIGKHISEVLPKSELLRVIATQQAEYDQEYNAGNISVITNRVPVIANNEIIGAIETFRDKQDVKMLAAELVGVKSLLDSMRAQSHEFINKLHAISGLIQMKQYDTVVELITQIYKTKQEIASFLVKRIQDKATAGLLIGKVSQAKERGIQLKINPRSRLTELPEQFSSVAMLTVLGNLIGNAMDAVADLPMERRVVEVYINDGKNYLNITVKDTGHGIPNHCLNKIFRRGFSTKQGNRGLGLSLVQQEVELSGGKIFVKSSQDHGSRFVVKIPKPKQSSPMEGTVCKRQSMS